MTTELDQLATTWFDQIDALLALLAQRQEKERQRREEERLRLGEQRHR